MEACLFSKIRNPEVSALFNKLVRELIVVFAVALGIGIVLKVLFPLTSIGSVAKLMGGVVWLFVLPGYAVMLPWQKEFGLLERVVVGMLAAAGMLAITSYYLGLAGLHIRTHSWLLPALILVVSAVLLFWRARKAPMQAQ